MSGEAEAEAVASAVGRVESAQDSNSDKRDTKDAEAQDIESRILAAMQSRVTYLREKADSFTFESVRRLLEEDLTLEKYALDVHKSFVKQHLVQCLEGADNDEAENSIETEKKEVTPVKGAAESPKEPEAKKDVKEDANGDDEKMEDSPVMGLLAAEKTTKSVAEEKKEEGKKEVLESQIKKALRKRASYIKANSEKITMGLLRRLLEKDLKLEKYTLDPYKKFINEQLDEVLQTPGAPKGSTEAKGKIVKKKAEKKASQRLGSEESSDSDGKDGEEEEEEEVNVKKKTAQKRKMAKSEGPKKRKREKETTVSAKKKAKPIEADSRSGSDAADGDIISDDGRSQSSSEKPVKKKEAATAVYGKRVEHLKSVIKSCGMSVSPAIYRKVKQAPEEKREATLIKELEQILAKEGLSSNPSEKEIKEVKKRKERARELEGIDMSNIVSSSRRRSTASFAPPPKPKITDESESDESEDSENEEEEEEGGEEQEDEEGGNQEGGEESQSEESNDEDDGEEESE